MIILKDNSPVGDAGMAGRCREIQALVDSGKCFLVDLLGGAGREPETRPQIFKNASNGRLFTGNCVGMFTCRHNGADERVIIGDRFGPDKPADPGGFLSAFPMAMLDACWDGTPLWVLEEVGRAGEADIYSQLLVLQLAALMDHAWKRGQLRMYHTASMYDSRVRGRLDLPRKIRRSAGLQDGRMAYEIREYSGDNAYNRLFYQACLAARALCPSLTRRLQQALPGFHAALHGLARLGGRDRQDTRALLADTRKKIANPVYRDYETLRRVARAVLRSVGEGAKGGGEDGPPFVTGIFLDVSRLWEDYLAKRVLPGAPACQETRPILGGRMHIRPDFLWAGRGVVLDAKYRAVWGDTLSERWASDVQEGVRDDVYQVLAYMQALNCVRGGVIFPVPRRHGLEFEPAAAVSECAPSCLFYRFPFLVPDECEEMQTFRRAMDEAAKDLSALLAVHL